MNRVPPDLAALRENRWQVRVFGGADAMNRVPPDLAALRENRWQVRVFGGADAMNRVPPDLAAPRENPLAGSRVQRCGRDESRPSRSRGSA
ncbi:MAG: hypothetical protein IJR99_09260 [Kiritimatiellae bacterium]|nr:hypothetical protein [Kiritimatiellia bacterium]